MGSFLRRDFLPMLTLAIAGLNHIFPIKLNKKKIDNQAEEFSE